MADREASGLAGALVGTCWLLIARVNNHEIYGDLGYLRTTWDTGHKIQFLQSLKSACFGRWYHGGCGLYGSYTSAATKVNASGQNSTLLEDAVLPSSLGGKDHHVYGKRSTRRRKRPPDSGVYISNWVQDPKRQRTNETDQANQTESSKDTNMLSATSVPEDRRGQ
jgi:hypothetical protein